MNGPAGGVTGLDSRRKRARIHIKPKIMLENPFVEED